MSGEIKLNRSDLITVLLYANDQQFEAEFIADVISFSDQDALNYIKELVERQESKLRDIEAAKEAGATYNEEFDIPDEFLDGARQE